MLKKLIIVLIAAVAAVALFSCEDHDADGAWAPIEVNADNIELMAAPDTAYIATSNYDVWWIDGVEARKDADSEWESIEVKEPHCTTLAGDWFSLRVQQSHKSVLRICLSKNPGTERRYLRVNMAVNSENKKQISVTQRAY